MAVVCPKCRSTNPDHARFCYHDGENLTGAGPPVSLRPTTPPRTTAGGVPVPPPVAPPTPVSTPYDASVALVRYGSGFAVAGLLVLLPACLAVATHSQSTVTTTLNLAAWCLWPVGVLCLKRVWAGEALHLEADFGSAVGLGLFVFVLLLLGLGADALLGEYVVRPLLGVFISEALAARVCGALLGLVLGFVLAAALASHNERLADAFFGPLALACGAGGFLASGLYHVSPVGEFALAVCLTVGVAVGTGVATRSAVQPHRADVLRGISLVGTPVTALAAIIGLWQAAGIPGEPKPEGEQTASAQGQGDSGQPVPSSPRPPEGGPPPSVEMPPGTSPIGEPPIGPSGAGPRGGNAPDARGPPPESPAEPSGPLVDLSGPWNGSQGEGASSAIVLTLSQGQRTTTSGPPSVATMRPGPHVVTGHWQGSIQGSVRAIPLDEGRFDPETRIVSFRLNIAGWPEPVSFLGRLSADGNSMSGRYQAGRAGGPWQVARGPAPPAPAYVRRSEGQVIAVEGAGGERITVDLGQRDGLGIGSVLTVYLSAAAIRGPDGNPIGFDAARYRVTEVTPANATAQNIDVLPARPSLRDKVEWTVRK